MSCHVMSRFVQKDIIDILEDRFGDIDHVINRRSSGGFGGGVVNGTNDVAMATRDPNLVAAVATERAPGKVTAGI